MSLIQVMLKSGKAPVSFSGALGSRDSSPPSVSTAGVLWWRWLPWTAPRVQLGALVRPQTRLELALCALFRCRREWPAGALAARPGAGTRGERRQLWPGRPNRRQRPAAARSRGRLGRRAGVAGPRAPSYLSHRHATAKSDQLPQSRPSRETSPTRANCRSARPGEPNACRPPIAPVCSLDRCLLVLDADGDGGARPPLGRFSPRQRCAGGVYNQPQLPLPAIRRTQVAEYGRAFGSASLHS